MSPDLFGCGVASGRIEFGPVYHLQFQSIHQLRVIAILRFPRKSPLAGKHFTHEIRYLLQSATSRPSTETGSWHICSVLFFSFRGRSWDRDGEGNLLIIPSSFCGVKHHSWFATNVPQLAHGPAIIFTLCLICRRYRYQRSASRPWASYF